MSVTRYRDVADLPAPPRSDPADPTTYARIRDLWRFSSRCVTPLFAPGVYRYRSIEASQAARDTAEVERMRQMRAHRERASGKR